MAKSKMSIEGNGNLQIGGDYNPQRKVSPYHPNAVKCPNCFEWTYRNNISCGNSPCDHPIKSYFDNLEQKKIDGQMSLVALIGMIIAFALAYLSTQFYTKEGVYFVFVGLIWFWVFSPKKGQGK